MTGINTLKELKRLAKENACCRCEYFNGNKCILETKDECIWKEIIKDLERLEKYDKMFNQKQPNDMDFVDRDSGAALFSLHCLALKEKGVHKDYYWLASKLDEIIKKDLDKPQELYNLIKEKKENAKIDYEKSLPYRVAAQDKTASLQGEIDAYTDVLCLIESMFKVKTNE